MAESNKTISNKYAHGSRYQKEQLNTLESPDGE